MAVRFHAKFLTRPDKIKPLSDYLYNLLKTKLLEYAEKEGGKTRNRVEMGILQCASGFKSGLTL